jgi:hypothetical protein
MSDNDSYRAARRARVGAAGMAAAEDFIWDSRTGGAFEGLVGGRGPVSSAKPAGTDLIG